MQFIFDNLSAILVGTVVLLILAGIQLSTQAANEDAGMYYMNRVQTLALIHMIERDFPNIGAGTDPQQRDMIVDHSWSGDERRFEFRSAIDSTVNSALQNIRYQVVPIDNAACDRAEVQCYEVQRLVDHGDGFQAAGSSNSFVTDFEIGLFPDTGDLADVREVRVRLAALSPGGENSTVSRTSWETRFRPFNLSLLAF